MAKGHVNYHWSCRFLNFLQLCSIYFHFLLLIVNFQHCRYWNRKHSTTCLIISYLWGLSPACCPVHKLNVWQASVPNIKVGYCCIRAGDAFIIITCGITCINLLKSGSVNSYISITIWNSFILDHLPILQSQTDENFTTCILLSPHQNLHHIVCSAIDRYT